MASGILRSSQHQAEHPNVEHEARRVVCESEHGRTDGGKSNPRASTSRQAAWLGCGRGLERRGHLGRQGKKRTTWPRFHAQGRQPAKIRWAIDRLGRSLSDLLDTIQHLEACGVDLYLDQQAIDTTTPMGKLVFQLTGAFAEFERTMIRQRIKAGLKRAVAQGVKLGRPKIDRVTERKVRRLLAKGVGILKVANTKLRKA